MSVRVEGMPELRSALRRVSVAAERSTRSSVKRTAEAVEADARARAPRRTGELANSITHEIDPDGLNATIGTNLWRAHFAEFGTRHSPEQPFLFPALEANRGGFIARLRREVGRSIAKAGRR